ncbi:MAG TPA: patatin-like phospholipase family protein [Verrucomicrobiae bacterium]|nr:patatin-like phospholipase family protein [Verrucomicrobiae bacterium]
MNRWIRELSFLLLLLLCAGSADARPPARTSPHSRPKIGVAFAGGSALGLAHVGVLKWFAEHHIPIDYVAGTSMGGLIGGMYASGSDANQIQAFISQIDWAKIFGPSTSYQDLSFRRKEDVIDFSNYLEFGYRGGLSLPTGLNTGQGVSLLISSFAAPYGDMKSFDELPTPFRCVATDLTSGKKIILDDGSLGESLRASMSLPAIFTPVQMGKMELVDGGLMDNLPVDVVKGMGADIVIAISLDNGEPFDPSKATIFSIAAQSISVMVSENERRSLRTADLVLAPDLAGFSAADFTRAKDLEARGYQAAEEKSRFLSTLALNDADWNAYVAARRDRMRHWEPPQLLAVEGGDGQQGVDEKAFKRLVSHPSSPRQVAGAIEDVVGNGLYSSGRYDETWNDGKPELLIDLSKKSYGPPLLNFGFTIDGSETREARFDFAGRVTFLDVGSPLSELRVDYSLGIDSGLSSEYYWRVHSSRFFIAPRIFLDRQLEDLYAGNTNNALYAIRKAGVGGDLGFALSRDTEFRFGAAWSNVNASLNIGSPDLPKITGNESYLRGRWAYDGTDNPLLPQEGIRADAEVRLMLATPDVSKQYPVVFGHLLAAHTLGENWLFIGTAAGGSAINTTTPLGTFTLGGPLQLSSLGPYQLRGDTFYNTNFYLFRRVFNDPIGIFSRAYLFGGYELGNAYSTDEEQSSVYQDGVLGWVTVTRLGVLFIGGSYGNNGQGRVFFRLGRMF